jgi:hypothetical protein
VERWTGPANIAWCPEHGLHGARDHCFECGKAVEQIPMMPISEVRPELDEAAHRVVLNFEGGIFAQLICPGDGRCLVKQCPACKADLTKAGSKRCDACEEINPDECWLQSWFDNVDAEELLAGKIEFPVRAEWDGDHPLVHIVPEVKPDAH